MQWRLAAGEQPGYLALQTSLDARLSGDTAAKVEAETRRIVEEAVGRAWELLEAHRGLAMPAAITPFGLPAAALLILLVAYRDTVTAESPSAMTLRLGKWAATLTLIVV